MLDALKKGRAIDCLQKLAVAKQRHLKQNMGVKWRRWTNKRDPLEQLGNTKRYAKRSIGARWRAMCTPTKSLEKHASTKTLCETKYGCWLLGGGADK